MEESVNENKWDSFAHVHFLTSTLFGCGKQDASVGLESIDVPEIEKLNIQELQAGKTVIIRILFQMMKLSSL